MAKPGAVMSLDAIGKQELYTLSPDPIDSFFKYRPLQHNKFALTQRIYKTDSETAVKNWPFGRTIKVTLEPNTMGDLLANMYLKCTLPELQDLEASELKDATVNYASEIGRYLIKKATLRVDGYELETIYGDWEIIYYEFFETASEKRANNFLHGGDNVTGPIPCYIPLHFFFSRKYETDDRNNQLINDEYFKPYFPLCAIHKQKIFIDIEFNPIKFCSDTDVDDDKPFECRIPKFEIVTEEVILTEDEKNFYVHNKLDIPYEIVHRMAPVNIPSGSSIIKAQLAPQHPVKTFFWFFRKVEFEDVLIPNEFRNRFNFSNSTSTDIDVQNLNPIMNDAFFFMHSDASGGFMCTLSRDRKDSRYFYKHGIAIESGMAAPLRDVFMYTYALKPKDSTPTGALDFSTYNADKTFMEVRLDEHATDEYTMYLFYTGFTRLVFERGFLSFE